MGDISQERDSSLNKQLTHLKNNFCCSYNPDHRFPRPILFNVGARNTEAAHIGLLGFTGHRKLVFEGNVVLFATDRLAIGAEYRQKPNAYTSIPGLVEPEDDWWSVVAAYVVNDHFTISGGVFSLGEVLNHYDDGALALKIKYEF
ncbi:MAG: DUF3034 family protein [Proteobacteria bacterium]|nr:DUF3034 family protein [Pseudomonadota bacterium]